jgi:hypothetical protein
VTLDRGVKVDDGRGIVAGLALVEALVRTVVVEAALVVVENGAGVSFVVDQEPVVHSERTLRTNRSA